MRTKIKIIGIITVLLFLAAGVTFASSYQDGTYIGTADDMQGTCTVEIQLKENAITRIALKEGRSDIDMSNEQLRGWLGEILKTQDMDAVDTVTGATMSCDLLKKAIFDALKQAEKLTDEKGNV